MDRRRLLISIKGDVFNPEDAIFSGVCTAKTVNIYCSGASGTDKIHYVVNKDGTYNWYFILPDKGMYWSDRFVWYNSDDVKSLKLSSKMPWASVRNNRFNSPSIESYDFGTVKIATNSLRESFYNCKKLKSLDISNWDLSGCNDLYAFSANNYSIEVVALPDTITPTGLTQVHKMFGWNWKLTAITGMKDVDFSKVTNFSEMFCECRELSDVEFRIDNWVAQSATDIHSMFLQCFKLDLSTLGDFTTWDVSNVTDFSYCVARTKTRNLDLSGWDMRSAVNINGMFQQNVGADSTNSLNTLNLSGVRLDPSKLTSHADVFIFCNHLQEINLTDCDNSTGMIEFIEDQLLTDIPDRVKSADFSLVLDDGNYRYADGQWTLQS